MFSRFFFAFRNQEDRKKQEEMERRRAEVEEKRRGNTPFSPVPKSDPCRCGRASSGQLRKW